MGRLLINMAERRSKQQRQWRMAILSSFKFSWMPVQMSMPQLAVREDYQRVRYLPPPSSSLPQDDRAEPVRWIVFPRYDPAAETNIVPLARPALRSPRLGPRRARTPDRTDHDAPRHPAAEGGRSRERRGRPRAGPVTQHLPRAFQIPARMLALTEPCERSSSAIS